MDVFPIIKVMVLATCSFACAMLITPLLTHVLYKYKLGKQIRDTASAPIYHELHKAKAGTPTMGGVLIWGTVGVIALAAYLVSLVDGHEYIRGLNFVTRSQTWLPLAAFFAAAAVGLLDDILNIRKIGPKGGGLNMRNRLILYSIIAAIGSWWFYAKLGWDSLHVPFMGNIFIGWWYIPVFFCVIVATAFSVNEIDGLDGLAGGTVLMALGAFGAIAFAQGRYDLATLCAVIMGATLAFLWFNIFPARFFMGDTGAMALGVTLGIVAMLTNSVVVLPVIGLLFVLESLSVIIQIGSKKIRKKKVFISAPFHHHLQAIGWPEPKIVMRFWVIGAVMAVVGVVIVLADKLHANI